MMIAKLAISSPDIADNGMIGEEFTARGENRTPRIEFVGVPEGTAELAVICHDPDAPRPHGFTHWVVYGIPPDARSLDTSADSVRVGPNGRGTADWYGPRPPSGHGLHHYYFWVYALSRQVDGLPTREEFLDGYADAIIEQARFVGLCVG